MSVLFKAVARHNYAKAYEDDLQLVKGDIVDVLEDKKDGWLFGRNGVHTGLFPEGYIRRLADDDPLLNSAAGPLATPTPAPTTQPAAGDGAVKRGPPAPALPPDLEQAASKPQSAVQEGKSVNLAAALTTASLKSTPVQQKPAISDSTDAVAEPPSVPPAPSSEVKVAPAAAQTQPATAATEAVAATQPKDSPQSAAAVAEPPKQPQPQQEQQPPVAARSLRKQRPPWFLLQHRSPLSHRMLRARMQPLQQLPQ